MRLAAPTAMRLDLVRLPLRYGAAYAYEHQLDVPGHHVGQRRRRALVVNRLEFRARERLEQLHVEVAARPDPERPVVELVRFLLGERDELLDVVHRQRGIDDQRVVDGHEPRDRRETLDRIIGQLGVEAGIDDERHFRPDQQRVAVGRGLVTYSAAIWLLAPGLFSTMTCWPQASVKRCASVRPSASVTPPGAAGTMIVTGLVG